MLGPAGFILTASSITFHTTHYQTSNEFIPELLRGLKAVHEVVKLDHIGRLGLRYLDAVLPQLGENVDQYLADGLHGVRFGATQRYALNESVFETEGDPLVSKGTLEIAQSSPSDQLHPGLPARHGSEWLGADAQV